LEKRKDSKGRILKNGEIQRSNGTYEFRYTDKSKTRHSIYAKTLEELRNKENEIQRDILDGIDISAGEITVSQLVARYMGLKRDLGPNSLRAYSSAINRIAESDFGNMKLRNIKVSDAKGFYISLHDEGLKRNTISIFHSVLHPAFEMAIDDDMIRKNPFRFKLSDILLDDSEKRISLTREQQEEYLHFLAENDTGNYYDDIEILLGTGLRVSELYGLTKNDVDLEHRIICIDHQLCRTAEKPYFVKKPKSDSGIRYIPMTDSVYKAFCRVISSRQKPKIEMIIDGYTGFLFLDKSGMPKVAMHLENYMRNLHKKHKKVFSKDFPRVTPHVLRHTFCTNLQRAGIDVKSLQYLMGHSKVSVTLDVYTHTDFSSVQDAFGKAVSNI